MNGSFQLLEQIEGNLAATSLPDAASNKILRQVVWSFQEQKQWQFILATLEAVRENAAITPDVSNYAVGQSTCAKAKQWQEALKLFEAIPKGQVQPSVISYNAAISACEKGWQWQHALKLFEAVPKAQVQPSVISYNAAISACEKGWQWQQALKLFWAIPKTKGRPNVISYSAAISSCEKGGSMARSIGVV